MIKADSLLPYTDKQFVYVETGTLSGFSLNLAVEAKAVEAYSCDIDQEVVDAATKRFELHTHVHVNKANSATWLYMLLPTLPKNFLVLLLDAHTDKEGPLIAEIQAIRCSRVVPDIILIDDWRYVKSHYWGFGESDVMSALKSLYGDDMSCTWKDGNDAYVDVLEGPAINDVLEVRKVAV